MYRGKAIVVLDESEQIRETLTTVLKRHGYIASGFDSLDNAIEFCLSNRPDLLIVNFYKTGFRVEEFSGKMSELNELPLVCITGSRKKDNYLITYFPNLLHILHKPVRIKELITLINDYFDTKVIQEVPIFNGDLGSVDIWKLLKNIEESGVSGHIEILTKESQKIKFTLKKGMLDDLSLTGNDINDPINLLLNEKEGIITIYQQLVNLATLEEDKFDENEKEAVLFNEEAQTVEHNLLNLLEKVSLYFMEHIGRQDTLKAYIKIIAKMSASAPDLKLLNINYKGQVTWEGEKELTQVDNYLNVFARLLLKLLNELSASSGEMTDLYEIIPEENLILKESGFYKVYNSLLD
jgi:CheY-like chemotaxis protein